MSNDNDYLTNHDYDGIQEYDNPLPNWWLVTFMGTVIFGFIYWVHYEFGGATTQIKELKMDLAQLQTLNNSAKGPSDTEEELTKLMGAAESVAKGKEVYQGKCAVCHGNELQGVIGPNLVDDYWIHGKGKLVDMSATVRTGVLDKGMPSWDGVLKDDEIKSVVAFVGSLRGTQPANPKAPQGEKVVNN